MDIVDIADDDQVVLAATYETITISSDESSNPPSYPKRRLRRARGRPIGPAGNKPAITVEEPPVTVGSNEDGQKSKDDSSSDSSNEDVVQEAKVRTRRGIALQDIGGDDELAQVEPVAVYGLRVDELQENKRKLHKGIIDGDLRSLNSIIMPEKETLPTPTISNSPLFKRTRTRKETAVKECIETIAKLSDEMVSLTPPSPPPLVRRNGNNKRKGTKKLLQAVEQARQEYEANMQIESLMFPSNDVMEIQQASPSAANCNKEIVVKLRWRNKILRIPMKRYEKFISIIKHLEDETGASRDQILLCLGDQEILLSDTPLSINLSIADIIDCGLIYAEAQTTDSEVGKENVSRENTIRLKIQTKDLRSKVILSINKNHPMSELMESYAQQQQLELGKLVFMFDGEEISPSDSPEDLDLEDEYCIDVKVNS